MAKVIDNFHSNEYGFLSNFFPCPVNYDGLLYPSSEHAYQAAKTLNIKVRKIFVKLTAAQSKALGKEIKIRADWETIKLVVMEEIISSKFKDFQLKKLLLETEDAELIEGNPWHDTFWGVCNGKGQNHLGKILMRVREKLRV